MIDAEDIRVRKDELERFAFDLLIAGGAANADAATVANALVWSDLRGRSTQGVHRLPVFLKRLRLALISSPASMKWKTVGAAAAMLDADNAFGHVAGKVGMEKAIDLAKSNGIGIVTVRRSNLYGAAAYFCSLAAEADCLGLTCTNAFRKVAPHGGKRPVFGTNPIAFGCPTSSGIPILVDLSTSAIAGSTARSIDETQKELPPGVALDKQGNPTTNPKDIEDGTLLPASGAKGFGLALMVEILCGVLAGAAMGPEVGSMYSTFDKPVNTGHLFIAIDIQSFQEKNQFIARVDQLISWIKASAEESGGVRYPGELRGDLAASFEQNGIPISGEAAKPLADLARALGIECPWHYTSKTV